MATLPEMVTIHYERKYSDGNYGSEGISLQITYGVDDEGTNDEVVAAHIQFLRQTVLSRLAQSPAYAVRRAAEHELGTPTPGGANVKVTTTHTTDDLLLPESETEDLPY